MKCRPLHENVLIRRLSPEEKSKGGIIIPDNVKEKPLEGEVVAIGPGRWSSTPAAVHEGTRHERPASRRMPMGVSVGDRVLFGKYVGNEIRIDGEEFLIVAEPEILGVIEGAPGDRPAAA
jgi:chaperonin GroES